MLFLLHIYIFYDAQFFQQKHKGVFVRAIKQNIIMLLKWSMVMVFIVLFFNVYCWMMLLNYTHIFNQLFNTQQMITNPLRMDVSWELMVIEFSNYVPM